MAVPKYLQDISESIELSKYSETIKLKCRCGHILFKVFENCNAAKKISGFSEIIRENGNLYLIKRNLFGKIVERMECKNTFALKQQKVIKAICDDCGKEYIIFDNYKHGYDAVLNFRDGSVAISSNDVGFKPCSPRPMQVYVKIYQDISYEEFQNEFCGLCFEDYLCSFSNISIYAIDSQSRKIKIHSEETA